MVDKIWSENQLASESDKLARTQNNVEGERKGRMVISDIIIEKRSISPLIMAAYCQQRLVLKRNHVQTLKNRINCGTHVKLPNRFVYNQTLHLRSILEQLSPPRPGFRTRLTRTNHKFTVHSSVKDQT